MSQEKQPPRLHGAQNLSDAAQWLSIWSNEHWTVSAVLGRFVELEQNGESSLTVLLPEGIKVIVPADTFLFDVMDGKRSISYNRAKTLIVGGAALGQFLRDLHEHGEAVPEELWVDKALGRWRTNHVFNAGALRLTAQQVEDLLPAFDALVRSLLRGEHPHLARTLDEHVPGTLLDKQPVVVSPQVAASPVVASTAKWTVIKPRHPQGYGHALPVFLSTRHCVGGSLPFAREVMDAWRAEKPPEIYEVMSDQIKYYGVDSDLRTANLSAIRKAIARMTKRVS